MPAVLKAYDFSGIGKLLDVACGHGALLGAILKEYPQMLGMLFDLDHVIEGTRRAVTQNGLEKRCELLSGDFFSAVPQGADAIVLKHIIHDWDDAESSHHSPQLPKGTGRKGHCKNFAGGNCDSARE